MSNIVSKLVTKYGWFEHTFFVQFYWGKTPVSLVSFVHNNLPNNIYTFQSVESLNMDVCHIPGLPDEREDVYQKESLYNHYLPYSEKLGNKQDD